MPITGRQRGATPDIEHPRFSIEVKDRESLPAWLHDAMAQAIASVRGNKIPIVILHAKGMQHADDFVLLRLGDFTTVYLSGGE